MKCFDAYGKDMRRIGVILGFTLNEYSGASGGVYPTPEALLEAHETVNWRSRVLVELLDCKTNQPVITGFDWNYLPVDATPSAIHPASAV